VDHVYITLVTQGTSKEYYMFVISVICEIDLKAAAKSVGEKAIEMMNVTYMNIITGLFVVAVFR
jgi:Cys-tRNA(Pro)/Cys-tRNA(Cys) deacylase